MDEPQGPPRVTALVVSRNDEAALRRCLQHLEASTERDRLEILVVDDGSTDGSAQVISEFPSVISLNMPKRLGWTRAVNIGLRTAKGDSILLMRQDVFVQTDTISRLADKLQSSTDIGGVCPYTPMTWPFPSPTDLSLAWRSGSLPNPKDVAPDSGDVATDYPRSAPILVRRELLRAMNYLDQRFGHNWSDMEMCARIRSGGKKIVIVTDVPVDRAATSDDSMDEFEWTDSAHGIATWIGLHYGFAAGVKFRIAAGLHALGKGKLSVMTGVLSGNKIDGNQE